MVDQMAKRLTAGILEAMLTALIELEAGEGPQRSSESDRVGSSKTGKNKTESGGQITWISINTPWNIS